jgi:quercetin dioxygenase-like cupin family protein
MSSIEVGELEVREPRPGWRGRLFHSDHMTFAYYEIEAGSEVHLHHHPQEEVWHVVEGELELPGDREQPGRRRMAASGGFTAAARTRRCDGGGRC